MMQKRLKTILLIFFLSIVISIYFIINFSIGNDRFKNLKSLLGNEQKFLIKKYLFTDKYIQEFTDKYIQEQSASVHKLELNFKEKNFEIETVQSYVNLSNNRTLKKTQLTNGFYAGINNTFPGSGYIDFFKNKILVLSGSGVLVFKNNMEDSKENFKQIKNNINEFIGINQFQKHNWFSLKDMLIYNNKIFVSYTEEMQKDCWNTSMIYGDMNFENIKFEKLFSPKECVHSTNNVDKEFNAHQSVGRMISYDDNHILLTIGDYRNRHLSQNKESVNGKIIKINIDNNDYKIISMGHRNIQGLHFDEENNFILATEHGPKGGDEINLIDVNEIKKNKILNYGWAIASAGEHYSDSAGGGGVKVYKNYMKNIHYINHIANMGLLNL